VFEGRIFGASEPPFLTLDDRGALLPDGPAQGQPKASGVLFRQQFPVPSSTAPSCRWPRGTGWSNPR